MPATLGHIGLHFLASRCLIRGADTKWILAGCLIPDLPWIAQRIVRAVTALPAFEVRLYAIAQSSLIFCLVLSLALSFLTSRISRTFIILSLGSLLHLIADAMQTKWANGVLLFAPFSMELWSFDLFWPEDLINTVILLFGCFVALVILFRETQPSLADLKLSAQRLSVAAVILTVYIFGPLLMLASIQQSDLHFVNTLKQYEDRIGKAIEFDRARLSLINERPILETWNGEEFTLEGSLPDDGGIVSVIGSFTTPETIRLEQLHSHGTHPYRDYASYLGLGFILFWWGLATFNSARRAWLRRP